jgi:large subunit ribosomal protein L24
MVGSTKYRLKKDDKVKITAGKDKGKIGKILKVDKKNNRIFVENVNFVKRHSRPSAGNRQGGIIEKEASIHSSNAMLICNKCFAPVRIKMSIIEENGKKKKKRVCRKCGEMIDE